MTEVTIIQRRLTDYRVPLFETMRTQLASVGIRLRVMHGHGTEEEARKKDRGVLEWAEELETRYLLSGKICWQPFLQKVRTSDLVIVTQENKLVNNLFPLFFPRRFRLAFWGHGGNLQSASPSGLLETFKRITTNRVDWWFAYTGMSKVLVVQQGFPEEKITNLENAIDTKALRALCERVPEAEIAALRERVGVGRGPMGLFIGSLYPDKRIEFLVEAGRGVAERLPGFRLVVVGDGPQGDLVRSAAKAEPWLVYEGRKTGRDKAIYLRSADAILNPGLVGLGILDSFVSETPMITTDCHLHSPEIDYLAPDVNGVMTSDHLSQYIEAVVRVLSDGALRSTLQAGCASSAGHYTIENMAKNFCDGIQRALG